MAAQGISMSAIDSFIQGGAGIAEAIYGTVGTLQAKKEIDKLMANYPQWQIPQEYKDYLNTFKTLAGGKLPGYDTALSNINQTFAQTTQEAKEGALSSTQFQDTLAKLGVSSQQAKDKLDMASAQWQAQAMGNLAEAQYKMGDLKTQQWDQNINRLWQIKMRQQEAKKAQDYESIWAGLDTFLNSSEKFAANMSGTGSTSNPYKFEPPKTGQ